MSYKTQPAPARIELLIYTIRGLRVMLDSDLAKIYGVTTGALNQALKRNLERFPDDFVFQLSSEELDNLMSQIVISRQNYGGRRKLPWVFTEHGALMLASVLKSARAVEMSVSVVRAFVLMREQLSASKELAQKLSELEGRVSGTTRRFKIYLRRSGSWLSRHCRKTGGRSVFCAKLRRHIASNLKSDFN